MTGDEYIAANRALDEKLGRLVRAKAKLLRALRPTQHEHFVNASIRQFCAIKPMPSCCKQKIKFQSLRLLQNARPQYLASGEDISPKASTA